MGGIPWKSVLPFFFFLTSFPFVLECKYQLGLVQPYVPRMYVSVHPCSLKEQTVSAWLLGGMVSKGWIRISEQNVCIPELWYREANLHCRVDPSGTVRLTFTTE